MTYHIERSTFHVYIGPVHHGKSRLVHETVLLNEHAQLVCNGIGPSSQEADAALVVALHRVHKAQLDAAKEITDPTT